MRTHPCFYVPGVRHKARHVVGVLRISERRTEQLTQNLVSVPAQSLSRSCFLSIPPSLDDGEAADLLGCRQRGENLQHTLGGAQLLSSRRGPLAQMALRKALSLGCSPKTSAASRRSLGGPVATLSLLGWPTLCVRSLESRPAELGRRQRLVEGGRPVSLDGRVLEKPSARQGLFICCHHHCLRVFRTC